MIPDVYEGLVLCRVTVNMDGAPHGSQVWVNPDLPKIRPLLDHGMLVPIDPLTGDDQPLDAMPTAEEGQMSPGPLQAVTPPPADSGELMAPAADPVEP